MKRRGESGVALCSLYYSLDLEVKCLVKRVGMTIDDADDVKSCCCRLLREGVITTVLQFTS
jgi:hypothetical protein